MYLHLDTVYLSLAYSLLELPCAHAYCEKKKILHVFKLPEGKCITLEVTSLILHSHLDIFLVPIYIFFIYNH